jgi:hypothetical protein
MDMKITMEVTGPKGKFWDNASSYYHLPEIYAWEIAAKAALLASAVENTVGQASGDDPAYTLSFHVVMDGSEPKLPAGVKGQVKADRLQYSQVVALQDMGLELLADLQKGAHAEITAGLRK